MTMRSRKYLVLFHAVTCGQSGAALGSDEQDIILISYLVVDSLGNKVLDVKRVVVRPDSSTDVNDNLISEELRNEYKLHPQEIKSASSLHHVITDLDAKWREVIPGPFALVTDGQLTLRQSLFPEAFRKDISLPSCFHSFHDLRKEFVSAVNCAVSQESLNVESMACMLGLPLSNLPDPSVRAVDNMCHILERLAADGHDLHLPEVISTHLLQGIRSKGEKVDGNCVVRARGLPWQASDTDIAHFFVGLNIAPGGVALCLSSQGRRNGEALVLFNSLAHRDMALKRHKHHIGNRYIEVYKATGEDFIQVAGGNNTEAQEFLTRGGKVIIRMRGLPYDCTQKQVLEFFASGSKCCEVLDDEQGVLFVKKIDGRSTGDAFVLFGDEKDADKALSKHKELIGTRYIELFRSTTAEVQQVLNRTIEQQHGQGNNNKLNSNNQHNAHLKLIMNGATSGLNPGLHGGLQTQVSAPLIPQQLITAGIKKDCIRLRGLPYEAQVEHILEFLGEHSRNIVVQGVHMVFNAQGQPSGEAFIQMDGEVSAQAAANTRHNRYMNIGKKQRYIEVLQCSGEDMSLVLTGGALAPPQQPPQPNQPPPPQQQQHLVNQQKLAAQLFQPMLPLNPQLQPPTAGAGGLMDPLQQLNHPALLMSNMYLVPPPNPSGHQQAQLADLQLLAAAGVHQPAGVFMLPQQRLMTPGFQPGLGGGAALPPHSQYLMPPPPQHQLAALPPPHLRNPAALPLPFPPPAGVAVTLSQPSKRTHDQAFHSPNELLPTKRPPVVYSSEAGAAVACTVPGAMQANFT